MNDWMLGVSSALLAALCWAVATLWYKKLTDNFSNVALNFHKGWLTIIGVVLVYPFLTEPSANLSQDNVLLLLVSGAIGIGIGDTALFAALKRLSEKQTLLVAETTAPVFVVFGGMFFLNEILSLWQWLAVLLIVVSVDLVVGLRSSARQSQPHLFSGIALALIAALCQAIGILMVRSIFVESDIHPAMSVLLRISGGLLILLVWLKFDLRKLTAKHPLTLEVVRHLLLASVVGTLIALFLVQVALLNVDAAVVQTLIATSAIFSAIIAVIKGEQLNKKVWLGLVIAWSGVCLMIFSG